MKTQNATAPPVVSVIIPCYNHGHYLPTAIESVQRQSYPHTEIVVVDDGSTDRTRQLAQGYERVKYVYQANQGLSASRNTGIRHSTGQYLVFLDADDWLYPEAIATNLRHLQRNPQAAFVSGAYINIFEEEERTLECKLEVRSNHYVRFLDFNYVGMIAAVLFQRSVLDKFQYDTSLRTCEDHDLYLRISRNYPVIHHTAIIAAYRRHAVNMSSNVPLMLSSALKILKWQKEWLRTPDEKRMYRQSYNALYQQLFSLRSTVPEENYRIFKEDRFTFIKHKYLSIPKRTAKGIKSWYSQISKTKLSPSY